MQIDKINIISSKTPKFRIGIVGHGFVGKAVDYAFQGDVEKFYVDPNYSTTIDDLIAWKPNLTFICVPTPMRDNGTCDTVAVEDAVFKIWHHTKGGVVLKSTIPPNVIDRILSSAGSETNVHRFVYNPEFLRESNAYEDMVEPELLVLGGTNQACAALMEIYRVFSTINISKVYTTSAVEASFVKYAINTFLATKLTFFNQLYDAVTEFGCNYNVVSRAIVGDNRIGKSHVRVPGPDNKRGFGGACFPKDIKAFTAFTGKMSLLNKVTEINDAYRSEYDLDEREVIQNINYGKDTE